MSRSDAHIIVTCDKCGLDEEIKLTALARRGNWDERNVDSELEAMGWLPDDDKNHDICEECLIEMNETGLELDAIEEVPHRSGFIEPDDVPF